MHTRSNLYHAATLGSSPTVPDESHKRNKKQEHPSHHLFALLRGAILEKKLAKAKVIRVVDSNALNWARHVDRTTMRDRGSNAWHWLILVLTICLELVDAISKLLGVSLNHTHANVVHEESVSKVGDAGLKLIDLAEVAVGLLDSGHREHDDERRHAIMMAKVMISAAILMVSSYSMVVV